MPFGELGRAGLEAEEEDDMGLVDELKNEKEKDDENYQADDGEPALPFFCPFFFM